jgi:hypothetical protein
MAPERKNPQRLFIKVIRENEKKGAPGERKKDALERIMRKIRPLEGELTLIDEIADREMGRDRLEHFIEIQTKGIFSGKHGNTDTMFQEREAAVITELMRKVGPSKGTFELVYLDTFKETGIGIDPFRSDLLAQCLRDFERTQRQMKQIEVLRPMLEGFFSEFSLKQTGKPVGELSDVEFYSLVARFVTGKGVEREPRE